MHDRFLPPCKHRHTGAATWHFDWTGPATMRPSSPRFSNLP